jgi:hypothetical protein
MHKKLFIIGNGFDIAHGLPTRFNPDFKKIAESNESNSYFWDLYQTEVADIWSEFEYCLGRPDYNSLESILDGYYPDYQSDYESDRDRIITQVDISGNLYKSLTEFAQKAENEIDCKKPLNTYIEMFSSSDYFINFNYTHTLEKLYSIKDTNVLHVHGEFGKDTLLLGYPKGNYFPEKYNYDATMRGHYIEIDIEEFINRIEDYYVRRAYENLVDKCKSFYKTFQKNKMEQFLMCKQINEIHVIGHSCKIDYEYFEYLNNKFPNALWIFNPYSDDDFDNVDNLVNELKIHEYKIKK